MLPRAYREFLAVEWTLDAQQVRPALWGRCCRRNLSFDCFFSSRVPQKVHIDEVFI